MDNELFELCKEVYKRHHYWADTDMIFGKEVGRDWRIMPLTLRVPKRNRIPLYTSDYLLEKLQEKYDVVLSNDERVWRAMNKRAQILFEADTPLKALLKLTIELHKQGLLEK